VENGSIGRILHFNQLIIIKRLKIQKDRNKYWPGFFWCCQQINKN
jgi:hypothetical protein